MVAFEGLEKKEVVLYYTNHKTWIFCTTNNKAKHFQRFTHALCYFVTHGTGTGNMSTGWLRFGRSVALESTRLSSLPSLNAPHTSSSRPLKSSRLLNRDQAVGHVSDSPKSPVDLSQLVRLALPDDGAVVDVLANNCPSVVVKITCLGFGAGLVCMLIVAALVASIWFAVAASSRTAI